MRASGDAGRSAALPPPVHRPPVRLVSHTQQPQTPAADPQALPPNLPSPPDDAQALPPGGQAPAPGSQTPAAEAPSAPPGRKNGTGAGEPERLPAPQRVDRLDTLTLDRIVQSVWRAYPLLQVAFRERQVADGKQVSAWGEFDLNLKGESIAAPLGFYQTYRNKFALEQPTFGGGYLYGGYKIGRGSFQPWFKERETNDAGEFSAGFGTPLLKGRAIDQRRADVWQAGLDRRIVEPVVRTQLIQFVREAAQAYWVWVASGQVLEAQRELLRLGQARVEQIEQRVERGDLGRIVRINNDQLIAARETKVIESERKLQMAAIKLSLFLRDERGRPVIPDASLLPRDFPESEPPSAEKAQQDIAEALSARPELVELDLMAERVRIDLEKAQNDLLPKLDAMVLAAKDIGGPSSPKRDKSPFELEAGLYGELPVQRRAARGKILSARGKLAQLRAKREFVVNKITAEVQDALSALEAAAGRIERARTNLRLARETLQLGREQFEAGDIDLIELNIYEQAVTDAQFLLIAAEADFFIAVADYRAALARDPLLTDE